MEVDLECLASGSPSTVTAPGLLSWASSGPVLTSLAIISPFTKLSGTQPKGLVAPVASPQTHPFSPARVIFRGAFLYSGRNTRVATWPGVSTIAVR